MTKHLSVFEKEIKAFKLDKTVRGVALIGSVAYGTATEDSDLDIFVLGEKDEFVNKDTEGICVEIHYSKMETAVRKLRENPMEIYKYIYSQIAYDDGGLALLFGEAKDTYDRYRTPEKELERVRYWLSSTKRKLLSRIKSADMQKVSYLLATNTWKVLEGVWAINNKPIPPSSIAFSKHELLSMPLENWFEDLLMGDIETRANTMLEVIDIILGNND